jgi:hypothetical protein
MFIALNSFSYIFIRFQTTVCLLYNGILAHPSNIPARHKQNCSLFPLAHALFKSNELKLSSGFLYHGILARLFTVPRHPRPPRLYSSPPQAILQPV